MVPRLWPGSTVVVMASGPSLVAADAELCRDRARILAVKDAVRLAPFADACYACDARWWAYVRGLPEFEGYKVALRPEGQDWKVASERYGPDGWPYADVDLLTNTGETGLETDHSGLRTGKCSGFQAVNLAVHLGAKRIVLLGYDMQLTNGEHHFFGRHPWGNPPNVGRSMPFFETLVEPLRELQIEVVNASRVTALPYWPTVKLEEALDGPDDLL